MALWVQFALMFIHQRLQFHNYDLLIHNLHFKMVFSGGHFSYAMLVAFIRISVKEVLHQSQTQILLRSSNPYSISNSQLMRIEYACNYTFFSCE